MKPKINLRLEIAGEESLLPLFENCLISYLKFFEIEKLLIYTTSNLREEVKKIAPFGKTYDIDKFYEENYDKFSESVKEVLDYAKKHNYHPIIPQDKERKLFYERMMHLMDYYLIKDSFILSDIDIEILENIKPILDWINSDYILYNADYRDDYYNHNPKIVKNVGGAGFFKSLPQFNFGWVCIPKSIHLNIDEIYKIVKQDISSWCSVQTTAAIEIIKNKIKTKILPRELMVTKDGEIENKTLAHFAPYGLKRKYVLAEKKLK